MHVNDYIRSLPRITSNGKVFAGQHIVATRNDDRIFDGIVAKVRDSLVTIRREDGSYRCFRLTDCRGWLTTKGV